VSDGSLRNTVKEMVKEEVLVEDEAAHAGGTAYRLSNPGRVALERVTGSLSPPGLLTPDQTVILVSGGELSAVAREFAQAVTWPGLSWAARFDGGPLFGLIAFASGAESVDRDRVLAAMQHRGVECMPGHIGWIKTPEEISAYGRAVAQGSTPQALESASVSE
jgi:hypothetical protein